MKKIIGLIVCVALFLSLGQVSTVDVAKASWGSAPVDVAKASWGSAPVDVG